MNSLSKKLPIYIVTLWHGANQAVKNLDLTTTSDGKKIKSVQRMAGAKSI